MQTVSNYRLDHRTLARLFALALITTALLVATAACSPIGPTISTEAPAAPAIPAGDPVGNVRDLAQSEWWLAEVGGQAINPTAVEPPLSLSFHAEGDADRFEAHTFCNYLGGSVRPDDERVFAVEGQTDFECPPQQAAQDQALLQALSGAAGLSLVEGHLALMDEGGAITARYAPKPEATVDPALAGSEWLLTSLHGAEPLPGTRITLSFSGAQVGGNAGCNSYGAEIRTVDGGHFVVGEAASTAMACEEPAGVMAQEQAYLDLFRTVAAYELAQDTLALHDENGELLLRFSRKQEQAVDPATLVGSGWRLVSYNGAAVDSARPITLIFGERRYWGQSSCRVYLGTYQATADDIAFPSSIMLGQPCPDEQLFLPEPGDYQFEQGQLLLTGTRGDTFRYDPLTSESHLPLAGARWQLLAFVGPGDVPAEVREPLGATTPTARFEPEGTVAGAGGCNSYSGSYENDDGTLSLGPLARTEMFCMEPEGVMEQEDRYLAWLGAAGSYQSRGGFLWLDLPDGRALFFAAAEEP